MAKHEKTINEDNFAPLSKQSVDTLIDLVEIKLSAMEVLDRDDAQEAATLEYCLRELTRFSSGEIGELKNIKSPKKRGRRRKMDPHELREARAMRMEMLRNAVAG